MAYLQQMALHEHIESAAHFKGMQLDACIDWHVVKLTRSKHDTFIKRQMKSIKFVKLIEQN